MGLICPVATANGVAADLAAKGNSFSLHTGNPGAAGTSNEASGSGYARQTGTFGTAALGVIQTSQMVFQVAANTYSHMCRWNGSTLVEIIDNPDITITPAGEAKVTHKITIPYVTTAP
ncbi:phage tail fiber protein [Rhodococcus erythropolis]